MSISWVTGSQSTQGGLRFGWFWDDEEGALKAASKQPDVPVWSRLIPKETDRNWTGNVK